MLAGSLALLGAITSVTGCSESEISLDGEYPMGMQGQHLIDDFADKGNNEPIGAGWEFISDQVMGGVSTGKIDFGRWEDRSCLHMTGLVSLENNGGFIQARLKLNPKAKYLDASSFTGVSIRVKGNGESYALHLHTKHTWLPWQFYQAEFQTNEAWQDIKVSFKKFQPVSLKNKLDTSKLKSIAIVAIKKEFQADILVDQVSFYVEKTMYKKLTPQEEDVIINKGTEPPFTGKYHDHFEKGAYVCKQCGARLFESSSKFKSDCGWPSFDDQVEGAVVKKPDADGIRTEILCANCGGHLGHVFVGEALTPKNTRYCVNSISMDFVQGDNLVTQRAIFASGCFWGTEYHLKRVPGVISTTVGYAGGHVDSPTYEQVCTGTTGHAESVEVVFDPSKTSYEQLARIFFETHDFSQLNRQGPDIGHQYRSAVFYLDENQKQAALKLIELLRQKGLDVKTEVSPGAKFWPAEEYHQDYYKKNGKTPYCHVRKKVF
jgi:peptide methionine sulfoxide reductase msrA/msrB